MRSRKRTSQNLFYDYNELPDPSMDSPTKRAATTAGKDGPSMGNYDPKYPESLTAFADGLRSDVMELIGTSAGLLNRSINFIFPFMGSDNSNGNGNSLNDSLHDIEVLPSNKAVPKSKLPHESSAKMKQSQDALRMRCQSLWSKEASTTGSNSSGSQSQKGGKVLLDKLIKNTSIQHFACGDSDDHLIILGNVRMIVAKKNFDAMNSASILWSQPFREIGTCSVNCSLGGSKGCSRLDISNRENDVYTIYLQDATVCVQLMMLIQSRCAALADPSAAAASSAAATPLSPLQIGSSPMTNRHNHRDRAAGGHKGGAAGRRKSKLASGHGSCSSPGNEENCLNGLARDRRLSAMSMSPGTPLREHESPFKKSKNRSSRHSNGDNGMEVVDLLGLSEMPTTPAASTSSFCRVPSSLPPPLDLLTSFADSSSGSTSGSAMAHISQSVLLKTYLQSFEVSGEPLDALLLRMREDGVDDKTIGEFQRLCEEINLKKEETAAAAAAQSDPLAKYQKMLKSGIPPPAVRQKMKLDGISVEDQDKLLGQLPGHPSSSSASASASALPAAAPAVPPPLPPHLRKYQVMLKSGVPQGAVNHKMTQENVSLKDRNLVLGISDPQPSAPAAPLPATSTSTSASAAETPKGPKFVGLHWDPIHAKDHQGALALKRSIWGEISSSGESNGESNGEEALHLQLAQEEYLALSSLFAKKDPASVSGAGAEEEEVGQGGQSQGQVPQRPVLRRKSSMPTTIDMSRSTNISIGLSSFKQKKMTIEMIIDSLNHFDVTSLGQEDLLRLQEILPTENEIKTLQNSAASEGDLHETELWLKKLTTVAGVSRKVKAMSFMVTAESSVSCVKDNLSSLGVIASKILCCEALRDVLKCILAIGNSMNQGTWKGGARAIKLASLTRLSQTKSVDGKSTVMDYLIQVIAKRSENGDLSSANALDIDQELGGIHIAKNINMPEVCREVEQLRSQLINLSKEVSENSSQLSLMEIQRLGDFIAATDLQISELETLLATVSSQTTELTVLFGEESDSSAAINQILSLLSEFLAAFTKAKETLEKRAQMEKRRAASASAQILRRKSTVVQES